MYKQRNRVTAFLGCVIGLYATLPVWAAPGAISDTPLIVTQTAKPNIMLMIDSSGSMGAFVIEAPYDENTVYANCPSSLQLTETSGSKYVDIIVKSDGRVYFETNVSGSWVNYDWDTSSGTGHTGNTNVCFKADGEYQARLHGDQTATGGGYGAGTRWVGGSANRGNYGIYTGNFMNWYFSNGAGTSNANFGAGASEKPGMRTRSEVAAEAANSMVDSFSNVNIGLTKFNGSVGGTLLESIEDIAINKASIKTSISNISPDGSTPLAETMEGIGRYFIEGFETANLTLHPNSATPTIKQGDAIFSHELDYGSITKASATPVMDATKFCQKNFIVGLTDGFPTNDTDVDDDLITYASDGDSYALNDVALAMHEMDLRPDIKDLDGNDYLSNIVTYMIAFANESLASDTLLTTTAANGGGQNYAAADATQLASAFNAISNDIGSKTGSVASVAFNSSTLNSQSAVFQARFDTTKWSGSLIALPLDLNGNLPADTDGDGFPDPAWDAATKLDALNASELANRVIMTHDGSDGAVFSFTSNTAAPSAAHAADLTVDSSTSSNDSEVQARLNYIRGDRSNEGSSGNNYRSRNSILGDIVNSTPVYVGETTLRWPDTFGATSNRHYANFANALSTDIEDGISDRTPVLYVGANDGMLHGFNASIGTANSGKEVFSYIPRKVLSSANDEGLHYYVDDSYVHKFYVDQTPAISDVYIKNSPAGSLDWRTVLVGGLRAGGAGYFALDVTNPSNFANTSASAQNTVLWEFTDSDDSDLGYTFSKPVITKMNNGKWAAIFGNGYNSANGIAKLFVLFLEGGLDGTWTSGTDYIEITTGVGSSGDKNGLSSPAVVDLDGDGLADRVYAGDLKGNMWAFDVSHASNTGNWKVAYRSGSTPNPLFVARDSLSNVQPITAAPLIAKNTVNTPVGSAPNVLVMFGTGQYMTNLDVVSLDTQGFYSVWDSGDNNLDRSDLASRTLTSTAVSGTGDRRIISGSAIDWTNQYGWYIDLLPGSLGGDAAERSISEPLLRRSVLFFNTTIPDSRACSDGGGGWLMTLDFSTGLATTEAVFDANNDGVIDSNDIGYVGEEVLDGLPAQSGILGEYQYTPTSDGSLNNRKVKVGSGGQEGRLGWQELTPLN